MVGLLGADAGRQVEAGCNGSNYDEVGKTFELTGRQVRNRIRIIRPIAEKRDQKGLFDSYLAEAGWWTSLTPMVSRAG